MTIEDSTNQTPSIVENEELVEAPQINEELTQLNAANDEVSKALVTLEALALSIEAAPALTPMEARIVNASIERLNAQFELPTSSLGLEAVSDPRQAALEDVSSKIETFKKTISAIVDKIIELVKKFWEWMTLNGKSVKRRLTDLREKLKDHRGETDIPVSQSFKALSNEDGLSIETATDVAASFFDLVPRITSFVKHSTPVARDILEEQFINAIKGDLKEFSNHDGTFTIYKNIAGRSLEVAVNPEFTGGAARMKKPPYQARIVPAAAGKSFPASIKATDKQISDLIEDAIAVVDMCEKHLSTVQMYVKGIDGEIHSLKRQTKYVGGSMETKQVILRSYFTAINVFIDGVFTQSLRCSMAVANIATAYIKHSASDVVDA